MSRITPQIINLQTVDIIVDIPDVSTGGATLTVVDIVCEILSPTWVLSTYVLELPVVDIIIEAPLANIVRTLDVVDIVFEIPNITTYYPILLTLDTVDIVIETLDFHKSIGLLPVDIVIDIPNTITSIYSITLDIVDIVVDIPTFTILISGFFFCVDAGFIYEPGCVEGLIIDGIVQAGKINCGE